MREKTIMGMAAGLLLGMFGMVVTAQASVISGTSNVDFTNDTYTLSLADGAATYLFKKGKAGGFGGFDAKIKTGGSALVGATNFGNISTYFTDSRAPFIDGNLLGQFIAVKPFKNIPFSSVDSYLALAFTLDDGIHYGYARIAGTEFLGFGYETVAGMGIQAGAMAAAPNAVPEPGSLVMLAFGLALIGVGTTTARRRKS